MKINPELFDKCGYKLVFIHKETRIYSTDKSNTAFDSHYYHINRSQ